jgi:DNA polymerase IV
VRTATILHADLDAFYASVEQLLDPSLRGIPMAVGEGVVLAASYEARAFGVRSAMPTSQARKLCPHLTVVSGSFGRYLDFSKQVMSVFEDFTPAIEQISVDEAFLDVSGSEHLLGPAPDIARQIRARVRDEIGLPVSIGVATTKFLAKVASQVAKPDGLVVVEAGTETEFLHPLPVEILWGVGPVTAGKLRRGGVETVGDIATTPVETLAAWLGNSAAHHLRALADNQDPRPVRSRPRAKSVGSQQALGRGTADLEELDRIVLSLAERIGRRLRAKGREGRTVNLRARFPGGRVVSRSETLDAPIATTDAIDQGGPPPAPGGDRRSRRAAHSRRDLRLGSGRGRRHPDGARSRRRSRPRRVGGAGGQLRGGSGGGGRSPDRRDPAQVRRQGGDPGRPAGPGRPGRPRGVPAPGREGLNLR